MRAASCKTINKRQLSGLHHVKILTFTAGYARKEAQVHAGMRLVLSSFKLKKNLAICCFVKRNVCSTPSIFQESKN